MARGFTADIGDADRLSRPYSGGATSELGAIGDAIGGLAKTANYVVKTMEARDARDAGNEVANTLTDLVQENFGATPAGATPASPALVGQQPDAQAAAAASSPVVKDTMRQLNRLDQANRQGALNPQELFTRGSVIVQDAINKNPLFAQEIRQQAQAVLGVQPTQELVKLAGEDAQRSAALKQQVTTSQVMAAANSGITYLKPDGSIDIDQMALAGGQLLFQEKQMTDQLKIAQLNAANMPAKPTKDEQVGAETSAFIKNANPVFNSTIDGMLASVPATIQKFANLGKDQQTAQVLQAVGTQQAAMNNWVDRMIIQNNVSPDAAKQIREYYNAPFDSLKGLTASGDFSSFATTAAALKRMNDTGQMNFRASMPITARLKDAGGDNAVASMFNVFLGTNTPLREGVNSEANGFLTGATPQSVMAAGANVMAGQGYNLAAEQNPDIQAKTLKGLVGTLNGYTQKPNELTPTEQKAYGNIMAQVSNLGLQSNDPTNLATAASLTNTPAALATFDAFAKDPKNANQVPVVAQGVIALNTKSILRTVPGLVNGHKVTLSGRPELRSQADMMMSMPGESPVSYGPPIEVTAVARFNPVTGRVEPVVFAFAAGKKVTLNPSEQSEMVSRMGDFNSRLAGVNRSLDAIHHLAPNGIGREKDLKPLELRQIITQGAGVPLKPGTKAVPMPSFMTKKTEQEYEFPKSVADAQIQQESGGRNSVVSNQGAVGIAQIRPQDFPQYDAEKLKNDPQYALNARDEIMQDLLRKHKGNIPFALAEYHGGPNTKNWGPKTFGYVSSILSASQGN